MNTPEDKQSKEINENECSDTWISFQAVGALPSQPSNSEEYEQLSLWKLTPTLNSSCDRISQEFQFTPISETTTPAQENSSFYQWDFPARVQVTQEVEQDYLTQSQHFGEKVSEYCSKLNPSSVLLNNLKELSNEDLELFLVESVWQDTVLKLKQSRRRSLEQDTRDSDCLSFPTLTSGQTSLKMRPAGQTKCEKWFKDKGLILSGSQLSAGAIANMMGFPSNWFEGLREQYSKNLTTPIQAKPQAESEPDILQDEQLPHPKQRSPSVESSISIPCLVKQPKHPEVRGIIRKDEGDRFVVYILDSDSTVTVSKLFVYPDFSKTVGQISPTKKVAPPSKIPPSTKRKQGDGTGYIECKPIKRSGKKYKQYWYHYEIWSRGDRLTKKSKYIPKTMLNRIEQMNNERVPVEEILKVLRKR